MKKKIKDLTLEECKKICGKTKYGEHYICLACPLLYSKKCFKKIVSQNILNLVEEEKEIEVDE